MQFSRLELHTKLDRVRRLLDETRLDAVLMTSPANVAWIFCGMEVHDSAAPEAVLVAPDRLIYLDGHLGGSEEAHKPLSQPWEMIEYDWRQAEGLRACVGSLADCARVAADVDGWAGNLGRRLVALRAPLLEPEVKRYQLLGRLAEEAMFETCFRLQADMTEFEIAGELARQAYARNLVPAALRIASDDRVGRSRDPQPTERHARRRAMLSLEARKRGQVIGLTRIVQFERPSEATVESHRAACTIEAGLIHDSRAGRPWRELYESAAGTTRLLGLNGQWHSASLGGPCGYTGIDFQVLAGSEGEIAMYQPISWAPRVGDAVTQDTILTCEEGVHQMTCNLDWPMIEVACAAKTVLRPGMIERY